VHPWTVIIRFSIAYPFSSFFLSISQLSFLRMLCTSLCPSFNLPVSWLCSLRVFLASSFFHTVSVRLSTTVCLSCYLCVNQFFSFLLKQRLAQCLTRWRVFSLIHSGYLYSASSSSLLLRGAPDYSIDTVSEYIRRSATGNCEWRTCPRSLRGS